ncbi:hypothetical protein L4D20_20525 [Vibrio kyushuensis]|uniref:hypothetical protein n=1 Tax=Vibrio kyushuensis TaxID=2910249 RepID=UPI003D1455ED
MNVYIKAVLCAALFVSTTSSGSESMIEHRGLSITCSAQDSLIRLLFTTSDSSGKVQLLSGSGNRMSSTIGKGSKLNYSMNIQQFPINVIYDAEGRQSEFIIDSYCISK